MAYRLAPHTTALLGTALLVSLVAASPVEANERRCQELGQSCTCSEPLNTASFSNSSGWLDPADSPDSTECPGESGGAVWWNSSSLRIVDETGMPPGNTVTKVWRNTSTAGTSYLMGTRAPKTDTKRMCTRYYFAYSTDWTVGWEAGCQQAKIMDITFNAAGPLHQFQAYDSDGFRNRISWPGVGTIHQPQTGTLVPVDCKGTWCVVELCFSGDLATGKRISVDGYLRRVSDGKSMSWPRFNLGDASGPLTRFDIMWIANMYRQAHSGAGCAGYRDISHAMQAEWRTDEGQYIGPAYEIEGSSPQTAPPPSVPSDPGNPSAASSSDAIEFSADASVLGNTVEVTSRVDKGVGPFQFLFDCSLDGQWNGIFNTSQPNAHYSCSLPTSGSLAIKAWVWDKGSDETAEIVLEVGVSSSAPLGAPGRPALIQ